MNGKRAGAAPDAEDGARGTRILIFEDDLGYAESLAVLLRQAGYELVIANHFSTALQALADAHPPDLLITDIVMPPGQVNGLAMARMARMKRRAIRVLYMTGYDISCAESEAFGPILRKPVTNDQVLAQVGRCTLLRLGFGSRARELQRCANGPRFMAL